jgi:hypothetical protein
MERELQQNADAMDDTADNADKMGDEIAEASNKAESSGGKFEKLGGILKAVGAAMASAFVAVGTAAVGATKALAEMSVGTAAYADEILTQSTVTGMSTEQLQAYSYAADLVDVSLDTLTGSMAKNIKSMDAARDAIVNGKAETNQMALAYAALGIEIVNADGTLKDSEEVYWAAIDALGGMAEGAERDAIAMTIFGKSAQDLNPLIAQGSAGIAELTEEAHRMGAVMSQAQLETAGKFDDVIQKLTQGSSAAKNALGMVLMPQLTALGTEGVELLGEFTRGLNDANGDWSKISEVIGSTVGKFADVILEQLPQVLDTAMTIVGSIGGAIGDNLPQLVDTASEIVMAILEGLIAALPNITAGAVQLILALVNGIITNLPALVEAAIQMVSALVQGLAEALPELIPAAVNAVVMIVQGIIDNLPLLLDAALQLVLGLAQGILDAIPQLIEKLPQLIMSIVDFIVQSIPQIIEAGVQLLTSLVTALPDIIAAIVAVIPEIITGIITAITENLPLIIEAGITLFLSLIQALPDIILQLVAAIPQIIDGIITALTDALPLLIEMGVKLFVALISDLPTIMLEIVKAVPQIMGGILKAFGDSIKSMVEVGGNLIKGLWQGISDAGAWLRDKISGFFGGVVDSIKNFFGIASPSKMFSEIGGFLGQGLGIGFENEMEKVTKDMQNAVPTEFNAPNVNIGDGGHGSVSGVNSPINVSIPLMINGTEFTRVMAQLQWQNNTLVVRNQGVLA